MRKSKACTLLALQENSKNIQMPRLRFCGTITDFFKVLFVGKTLVIFKIKPRDLEKIDETIEQIKGITKGIVKDIKKVPIGFGVEIIKAAVLFEEKKEDIDGATKEICALPLVEEAEMEGMTLL